jgi:para-nitrobenzyl esterase
MASAKYLAALVAGGVLLSTGALAQSAPATVKTETGLVQGKVDDGVLSFKGVPFAKPPLGDLRWRPPEPAAPWTGVRVADQYGHDCMQKPFPSDAAPLGTEPAEDCLVLNVWRPSAAAKGKLPVMVWIYGGGFVNGGSSPEVYSGAAFAKKGVVFVSFNYRIGRLGFFAFPALSKEQSGGPLGNYGYMDQIAALKWVKQNIAAFGGDPDNVTVFGESAGGGSVNMLLTSPAAKGLFNKAIIESGGGRGNLMGDRRPTEDLPGLPSGESVGVNFAKSKGIEGTGPEALAKLRALPASAIGDLDMMSMASAGPPTYAGPMQDGKIVVESPEKAYRAGREAKVPVMIGANSSDIGFAFAKTADELFAGFGANAAKARGAYDPDKTGNMGLLTGQVGGDQMMVEPARFVASTLAAQGLSTYEYRFSYVAASMKDQWKTGAPHATEIPYVFDTVKAKYGATLDPKDEALAQAANTYWVNFAKTGDPNGPGLPHWPRYQPGRDEIMDFSAAGTPVGEADPWKTRLDVTAARADNGQP